MIELALLPRPLPPPPPRKCSRCKGLGWVESKLLNLGTLDREWHIHTCPMPGCHNGIMNLKENSASFY